MAGHEGAQIALAQHYRTGDIVAQDLVQSYAWFNIADSRGAANASVNREIFAGLLSGEQLNQAQTLSSQIYQKVSREAPPEPVIQGGSLRNILASSIDPLAGLPQYVPPSVAGAAGNTNLVSFSPLMGRNFTIPGLELEMIWIPAGKFMMGSPAAEPDRQDDETPHEVTLAKGFWLGKYEVTQKQYAAIMGNNPSQFKGESRPVEMVSWNDAVAFCRKLGESTHTKGKIPFGYQYKLPTEAQWEYACRAGTTTAFHFGATLQKGQANFSRHVNKTQPVGSYPANEWGLHDMHGNVWEWCSDWYGNYPSGSVTDPAGSSTGSHRVKRGGRWDFSGRSCRSANRDRKGPGFRYFNLGFRLSLRPE